MCALSLLNLLSPSLNVCPGIFVAAPFLHPPLCVPHFTCENSPSLRSNRILSVLFIFVLVLHTPPLSVIPLIQSPRPSTIGTGNQQQRSNLTPCLFAADRDPSEPVIVLLVLCSPSLFVWFVAAVVGGAARCQPACLPEPSPARGSA